MPVTESKKAALQARFEAIIAAEPQADRGFARAIVAIFHKMLGNAQHSRYAQEHARVEMTALFVARDIYAKMEGLGADYVPAHKRLTSDLFEFAKAMRGVK